MTRSLNAPAIQSAAVRQNLTHARTVVHLSERESMQPKRSPAPPERTFDQYETHQERKENPDVLDAWVQTPDAINVHQLDYEDDGRGEDDCEPVGDADDADA